MRSLIIASITALSACAAPIHVEGGPTHGARDLSPDALAEGLAPLIADSEAARREYARLESRTSLANVFLYGGLGLLAPCIALNAVGQSGAGDSTATYTGLAFCAGSVVANVAVIIVSPGLSDWGEVLRAHNREHPEDRLYSKELGVPRAP